MVPALWWLLRVTPPSPRIQAFPPIRLLFDLRNQDGTLHLSTGEAAPIARRQDLPAAFHREGSVYVSRREAVLELGSLYGRSTMGHLMQAEDSVNIDEESDWTLAECRLAAREP